MSNGKNTQYIVPKLGKMEKYDFKINGYLNKKTAKNLVKINGLRLVGGYNATYYKNYKKGWKNRRF